MSLIGSIVDRVPDYLPKSTIIITEGHEFTEKSGGVPQTMYQLNKSPFDRVSGVEAQVAGITTDLDLDSDIDEVTTDSTFGPEPDAIKFINSDAMPDVGTTFTVEYRADPIVLRFMETFDEDLSALGDEIDESIASKYIDTAPGDSLDRIGSAFGEIGRRRRRPDEEYRAFLRSIVRAFNANGTIGDVKFAVASALRGSESDITITEDFEQVGFNVYIDTADSAVLTASLNDLIELSSPTGVELLRPPVLQTNEKNIGVVGGESVATTESNIGSSTLSSGDSIE